jgi:hypothetical protein
MSWIAIALSLLGRPLRELDLARWLARTGVLSASEAVAALDRVKHG